MNTANPPYAASSSRVHGDARDRRPSTAELSARIVAFQEAANAVGPLHALLDARLKTLLEQTNGAQTAELASLDNEFRDLQLQWKDALRAYAASIEEFCTPDIGCEMQESDDNRMFELIETLSEREREVFRLMGLGLDMHEICKQMALSVKTVETYRARIRKKLGQKTRMGLVRLAVEWSLTHRRASSLVPSQFCSTAKY